MTGPCLFAVMRQCSFVESCDGMHQVRTELLAIVPVVLPGDDGGSRDHTMSEAEMRGLTAEVQSWLDKDEAMMEARTAAISEARDALLASHRGLTHWVLAAKSPAIHLAEKLCLARAQHVGAVAADRPAVPPSPLEGVPATVQVSVKGSRRARRSALLSSIGSMQAQRASLLSQGTDCPSTDALDAARRKLKVTTRRVAQLQLEHDHAVEDGEDTTLTSTALAHALAERRSAACAIDQHSLRLALASSRWPELRFFLGEDVASARSLEVFEDQSTIAAGPPTTRFKVIRG